MLLETDRLADDEAILGVSGGRERNAKNELYRSLRRTTVYETFSSSVGLGPTGDLSALWLSVLMQGALSGELPTVLFGLELDAASA